MAGFDMHDYRSTYPNLALSALSPMAITLGTYRRASAFAREDSNFAMNGS